MKISTTGNWNNPNPENVSRGQGGFTILEISVVLVLMGLFLSIALPRIQPGLFTDSPRSISRKIAAGIQTARQKAIQNGKDFILHLDLDRGRLWVSDKGNETEKAPKKEELDISLPKDRLSMDVAFSDGRVVSSGVADIRFFGKGYSDYAIVHIACDGQQGWSLIVEPFIAAVRFENECREFRQ